MLPVGVGSGAVVLSNGRVVGGISVTLVTTVVELKTGSSVDPVPTGIVRVEVVFTRTVLERVIPPVRSSVLMEPVNKDDVTLAGAVGVGGADVEFTLGITSVVVKPVDSGTVSVRVVFILGV